MGSLFLIRHAQASYGQADYDRLSTRGVEQARALAPLVHSLRFDAVYRGPHVRHEPTATNAGLTGATVIDELAEYPAFAMVQQFMPRLIAEDSRFAELTTNPSRELADAAFKTCLGRWMRDEWHGEGVERVGEFATRVRAGLDRVLGDVQSGARIGIVTSAGPIGVAVGLVFAATEHHMVRTSLVVRNASVTQLAFRSREFAWHPERVSLVSFNATHHLPAELHTEY